MRDCGIIAEDGGAAHVAGAVGDADAAVHEHARGGFGGISGFSSAVG